MPSLSLPLSILSSPSTTRDHGRAGGGGVIYRAGFLRELLVPVGVYAVPRSPQRARCNPHGFKKKKKTRHSKLSNAGDHTGRHEWGASGVKQAGADRGGKNAMATAGVAANGWRDNDGGRSSAWMKDQWSKSGFSNTWPACASSPALRCQT